MPDAPFTVVRNPDKAQLILPMPLPYVPVPTSLQSIGPLELVLAGLWMICSSIIRKLRNIEPPPKALFTIDSEEFRIDFVAPDSGHRSTVKLDPKKIVDLRKNQFTKGLYIHVSGESMNTYLQDEEDDVINPICEELLSLLSEFGINVYTTAST